MAGQPKKFENGKELIKLFNEFCAEIPENGYTEIPSQTCFCRWLEKNYTKVDRRTIYNSLNKYFPTIKKDFENLQSDVIAQGGMLGKYNPTMSIFVLKNWCKWGDKVDTEIKANNGILEDITKYFKEKNKGE